MQTPVIPATRRQGQKEDSKFEVSPVYLANARLARDILSQMSNSVKQRPRAQGCRERDVDPNKRASTSVPREKKSGDSIEKEWGMGSFCLGSSFQPELWERSHCHPRQLPEGHDACWRIRPDLCCVKLSQGEIISLDRLCGKPFTVSAAGGSVLTVSPYSSFGLDGE